MTDVAVVGSANLDIVARTPVRPVRGETVIGTGYEEHVGGKGVNQVLAAAARAARTAFIGAVGSDDAAQLVRRALLAAHIDVASLSAVRGSTGRAIIAVTPDGENDIIVLPLASAALTGATVSAALDRLLPCVVLTQLEVSESATEAVADWCATHAGTRLVLNASPVRDLPPGMIGLADPLIVNETEARAVLDALPPRGHDHDAPDDDALALELAQHARSVVLTLGKRGAITAAGSTVHRVAGVTVSHVVDTTGAGDVFAGTLAAELSAGAALPEAAGVANAAAATAVASRRDRR